VAIVTDTVSDSALGLLRANLNAGLVEDAMDVFLIAFSCFNFVAGLAGLWRGVRLWAPGARGAWASTPLYLLAVFIACALPLVAGVFTVLAWDSYHAGAVAQAGPLILAPVLWLILMGLLFAVIDFADDGRFNFGRRARNDP
jgi:hypothetical protein